MRRQCHWLPCSARRTSALPWLRWRQRSVMRSFAAERPTSTADSYDFDTVERKWRSDSGGDQARTWAHREDSKGQPYYALSMFPYPSGRLHMGHVRVYTISDSIARCQRMQGRSVLHPIGWDSFGLPAENAAIHHGVDPQQWTRQNIEQMRKQLHLLGISFDWDREIATSDATYYKWTQWLFTKLFEAGLAYQKEAVVNWDPVDQTVLANEQVDAEGRSWRSGAVVEQRKMRQWFLRITDFADALLDDLPALKQWPESVKTMQANWIGRSTGWRVSFAVQADEPLTIDCFTTRLDTLMGCSFVVVSPDHALLDRLLTSPEHERNVSAVRGAVRASQAAGEPVGAFTGSYVTHPITGKPLPVWVADYVVADYGSGALMAVPAHDARDHAFARTYGLPVIPCVRPREGSTPEGPFVDKGILFNSGAFDDLSSDDAIGAIGSIGQAKGWASASQEYRLRDWLISRQRYWGAPIPVVHCDSCGPQLVPMSALPVELPPVQWKDGDKTLSLTQNQEWCRTTCPKCGAAARRETDTMDTFVDSSWYFLRYLLPHSNERAFPKASESDPWLPVNAYVGGIEHAILHLLYARFITKFLASKQYITCSEPFERLVTQGMVQSMTYRRASSGTPIPMDRVDFDVTPPQCRDTGEPVTSSMEKMSKSKFNGVDPERMVGHYGADTVRLFTLFKAPAENDLEWSEDGVAGQARWLRRIWNMVMDVIEGRQDATEQQQQQQQHCTSRSLLDRLQRRTHRTIAEVHQCMNDTLAFNVAISSLMKLSNEVDATRKALGDSWAAHGETVHAVSTLLTLLNPFAPHITCELWQRLHPDQSPLAVQSWPVADPDWLEDPTYVLVVQVNGKARARLSVASELRSQDKQLEQLALQDDHVQRHIAAAGGSVKRVIVPRSGAIVNFVVKKGL